MESIQKCISLQTSGAAKVISRLSRDRLVPFGVTPIQFAVLQTVYEMDKPTSAEVGTALMIDSATIVGVIDRLEALHFLTREMHPVDRRIKRLSLTRRGKVRLPAMQAEMNDLNLQIDTSLGNSARTVRESLRELSELFETLKG